MTHSLPPTTLKQRDSSIEALKIVAMVAIVISHVAQTLQVPGGANSLGPIGTLSYCIDFTKASPDPSLWVLVLFRTLGAWGNTIFVISSAWFLCENDSVRLDKVVRMILDVFVISIAILVIAVILGIHPSWTTIVECVFPTTFANNWFITCYLLLYAIHPSVNSALIKLGKRGHAKLTIGLVLLYMVLPMIKDGLFFYTKLVFMISLYVLTAYVRRYMLDISSDRQLNLRLFLVGTIGMIVLVVLLEITGQYFDFLSTKMLHFDKDGNPLLVLSCLGLFNLVRSRPFVSVIINRIASQMLFVYLIHDNLLVRIYLRPNIWLWIHDSLGYDFLFLWFFLFVVLLFLISLFFAWLYKASLGRVVAKAEIIVLDIVRRVCNRAVD